MINDKQIFSEKTKLIVCFIMTIILLAGMIISIPTFCKLAFGKFTYNIKGAMDYHTEQMQSLQLENLHCEWSSYCEPSGCYCNEPPCKRYNIQGNNCVQEGYTGKGFLGMTDFDKVYYVCEGYGRMALHCEEYYTKTEWEQQIIKEHEESFKETIRISNQQAEEEYEANH